MRLAARGIVAAALVGLLFLASPGGAYTPISGPQFPSVGLTGYAALERSLRDEAGFLRADAVGRPFVDEQMMGILAHLQMRNQAGPLAVQAASRIVEAWVAAEAGFVEPDGFYSNVIPAPSSVRCIDVQVNAWALWAAVETRAAGYVVPDIELGERIGQLRAVLEGLLQGNRFGSRGACNAIENRLIVTHSAMPLMALLYSRGAAASSTGDAAIRNTLDGLIRSNLDQGFYDENGFFLARFNSQMLIVLTEAARIFAETSYAHVRDLVGDFIVNNLTVTSGERVTVQQLDRGGAALEGATSPADYAWTAASLFAWHPTGPQVEMTRIRRILDTLDSVFWSASAGAYAEPDGNVHVEANALATILTYAVQLRSVSLENPQLTMIVPARTEFQYADDPNVGRWIEGTWDVRFTLAADSPGSSPVILPGAALGPFNFTRAISNLYAPITLVRTGAGGQGTPVAMTVEPGRIGVLQFVAPVTPTASSYRLEAFPPVLPLYSRIGGSILLGLHNSGEQAVRFPSLQLELQATNITVTEVSVAEEPLAGVSQVDRVTTENLPEPHTRVLLPAVTLAPQAETEIRIRFSDVLPPSIGPLEVTREQRTDFAVPTQSPLTVLEGEPLVVRASVDDNVVLRTVAARIVRGDTVQELVVTQAADGQYVATVPGQDRSGSAILQFTAVDASGNFNGRNLDLAIKNPVFSGSVVLFVFSGTLFLSALIIWVKVRRKPI